MSLLTKPFWENGYSLALYGSVPAQGKGNDLDLLAVPAELVVTPPEKMERLMCELRHAYQERIEANGLRSGQASRSGCQRLDAGVFRRSDNDQPGFTDHDGRHSCGYGA